MQMTFCIEAPACGQELLAAIEHVLNQNGVSVQVLPQAPAVPSRIEHWPCPIESPEQRTLFFVAGDSQTLQAIADCMRSQAVVDQILSHYSAPIPSADLFALESIVTTCVVRDLTMTWMQSAKKPSAGKVFTQATQSAHKFSWVEQKLGTPCLHQLLSDFAESLLARGLPRS